MPRTWKSALAPFLAGIPERTGFVGEARFFLLNDVRFGERALPRMIDRCAALALTAGAKLPPEWPLPNAEGPAAEVEAWRSRRGLSEKAGPVVALAPGAVGPSKRWPAARLCGAWPASSLPRALRSGCWAAPVKSRWLQEIVGDTSARDLTGPDLRDAILALAAASAAVSNNSGLLHVAAALGTPTIGIFGPTSPWHWAPLNPLAATIETATELPAAPATSRSAGSAITAAWKKSPPDQVLAATQQALACSPRRRLSWSWSLPNRRYSPNRSRLSST